MEKIEYFRLEYKIIQDKRRGEMLQSMWDITRKDCKWIFGDWASREELSGSRAYSQQNWTKWLNVGVKYTLILGYSIWVESSQECLEASRATLVLKNTRLKKKTVTLRALNQWALLPEYSLEQPRATRALLRKYKKKLQNDYKVSLPFLDSSNLQ